MGVPILYIHPYGHLNDLVIPAGALTCLNSVDAPKLGRYAFEATDAEIRAARIVAVDLHWALGITGFEQVVAHVRKTNPSAAIIVGGVTAGHYPAELLERYPVDFVLRGDSEVSFRMLVEAILEDRAIDGIPNVATRDRPAPMHRRMTPAEFDATDSLTADWFPTYEKVSRWDAVAFPQGRTISVSRGCAFTCPECYGSYASTFGQGYLLRSPAGLTSLLRRAEEMKLRNLRLFVAKPSPARLSELLRGIASAGPFRFGSSVGFYLCMPPEPDDIGALEAAFDKEVAISMIPPEEHVPVLKPRRRTIEDDGWHAAAERISRSERLLLDVWTTTRGEFERTREHFAALAGSPKVKVSYGAVWSVTRPTDRGDKPGFDDVRRAVLPLWTFYLGRMLSPGLAQVLKPFQFLDELETDPDALPRPEGVLGTYFDIIRESWRRDHLPTIPGLQWHCAWARLRGQADLRIPGVTWNGSLTGASIKALEFDCTTAAPLRLVRESNQIRLHGIAPRPAGTDCLVLLPTLGEAKAATTGDDIECYGVACLRVGEPSSATGDMEVEIVLRAQATFLRIRSGGITLASGSADLGYFLPRGH